MSLRAIASDGSTARVTAHEYARSSLRRAILRGDLASGAHVPQVEWARRLAVSTTPVREALRDLASDGMVQLDAHRGAYVSRLTFEQVSEIYSIRKILEPAAMRDAAGLITPSTLARAERLNMLLGQQMSSGRWAELHCEFHDTLLTDLQSPRMVRTVISLRDSAAPYVAAARNRQGTALAHTAEHRELLEALRAGDHDRAAAVALQHLDSTMSALTYDRATSSRQQLEQAS